MDKIDKRFQEYYVNDKYKGFRKLREHELKLSGQVKMTFTNGEKEVFATGPFREATLERIFDKIDKSISN